MGKRIEVNPVTRIEGHAKVSIELGDDGKVAAAYLHVLEFRGFERFIQGMRVETMPTVTTRICGTCPHAHHLAAAKAVDRVFGLQIPPAARLLRELLNAGSMIHSHAIHFFALAGPDLFLGLNAPVAKRNLVGLLDAAPDLAKAALRLRTLGQRIAEEVGGRGTHPVTCVPGGVASGLDAEKRQQLQGLANEAVELAKLAVTEGKKALYKDEALIRTHELRVRDVATVNDGALDCYEGLLRVRSPDGQTEQEFDVSKYRDVLVEQALPYSYAKQVLLKLAGKDGEPYRVGALARLNSVDRIDMPLAAAEWEEMKQKWGHPCHLTVAQHHARLVELLFHAEKAVSLLSQDAISSGELVATNPKPPQRGVAHVEAPRGLLIHDFEVDQNANVTGANLLVATQHNITGINATVRDAAEQFLSAPEEELMQRVEFGIRCWDPCLSCSTHAVGQMPLAISVTHQGRVLRRISR